MQRYNIVTAKKDTRNGQEKTQWNQVGTLVRFPATQDKDEGFVLELHIFPETKFFVFEQKPRNERLNPASFKDTAELAPDIGAKDEIRESDIPF